MNRSVTIIATVRNEKDSIRTFVDSLLGQERPADEIIIVDGASDDGTLEILQAFSQDNKLKVISQDCNIAEGRNLGIAAASSEIIAVTDAGCLVELDWLAQLMCCFDHELKPDVVSGNFRFDCHSDFETAVSLATFAPNRETSDQARYLPSSRSLAFTKAAWQAAGGYPEWLYAAEDTLFDIRLRQLGFEFVFCKDAYVCWRPRENWRALAKQRMNFARGNGRVGIGTRGYIINAQYHLAILLPVLAMLIHPLIGLLGLPPLIVHIRSNLLSQSLYAVRQSGRWSMFFRVMLVMEITRLVGIAGYLMGRNDRRTNPATYVDKQKAWMGIDDVEQLQ